MRKLIKRFGWIVNFEAHEFEGIPLLVHFVAGEKCLGKVTSALEVIRDLDPRTYSSLTRLLPGGIAVAERTSVQGWYDSERRACCLGFEFVEAGDVEDIALRSYMNCATPG